MEDVWKDITTLSTSDSSAFHNHHHHHPTTAAADHQSVHDFLASQRCDQNPKNVSDHVRPSQPVSGGSLACRHSSATMSSVFVSSVFKPQLSRKDSEDDNGGGDRKYKRKMKNRESATRSRARRQAYTNELELELAHLREENAMLRRRLDQMSSAAAAAATIAQVLKKSTLLRSLTAPF